MIMETNESPPRFRSQHKPHYSSRRQTRRTHLKKDINFLIVMPVPKYVTANLIRIQSDWKEADQQWSDSDLATVLSWVETDHKPTWWKL